ncbi:MAG: MFS transporter [Chloroflexi bacterium]|nr:MFS transporter [Chloroflexota bacterium]
MRKLSSGVLSGRALLRFILTVIAIRLVRDTSGRMIYPFLPEYAAGLGLTLTTMGGLLMVRTSAVAFAPIFGSFADRHGPRRWLMVGFAVQGLGLLSFSVAHGPFSALAAIFLLGVSDAVAYPLMQAYVSEHSPSHRRGWALATVEYSWAISGIAMLPVVGWLITEAGWYMPFRLLSIGSFTAILILWFLLPDDSPRPVGPQASLFTTTRIILADRSALGALVTNGAVFIAAETFFVLWGAHLARNFHMNAVQVGRVAAVIGMMELFGSVTSSQIIDRVGKRRSVMGGTLIFMIVLLAMPWFNQSVTAIVIGLALASLCIEFTIVSSIPLLADQRPGNRSTMMALGAMLGAILRGATDPLATGLFESYGFLSSMAYAFVALLVAAWALWRWVEDRTEFA